MNTPTTVTPTACQQPIEDRNFWEKHIANMATSKLSRAAYCRQHHLNYDRAQYWYKKLLPPIKKPVKKLIAVKLESTSSQNEATYCMIRLSNGTRIEVSSADAFDRLLMRII